MGRLRSSLERYFNELWYERSRPGLAWRAASQLYRLGSGRSADYRILPPGPVIVVGNITVGGGGKTPVVAALAAALVQAGCKPAIISRGYGGRSPLQPLRVQPSDDPGVCGDEPLLLARTSGCPVWVGRKRKRAMQAAFDGGADVVISDDGLQHSALPRSFEIVVVDEARGFGNGRLLPAGPLRQPLSRLERVDLVLRKRAGRQPTKLSLPGKPFLLEADQAFRLSGRQLVELDPGITYDAVCGIANPDSFFATLEAQDLSFRRHVFPDHHAFAARDLADLAGPLLVTEKDAVKLERLASLPETLVLPVRARLPQAAIEAVLSHVREFSPR
jgi:tetraacyldisaccharide 4'-kinase